MRTHHQWPRSEISYQICMMMPRWTENGNATSRV